MLVIKFRNHYSCRSVRLPYIMQQSLGI